MTAGDEEWRTERWLLFHDLIPSKVGGTSVLDDTGVLGLPGTSTSVLGMTRTCRHSKPNWTRRLRHGRV
ncbi:hypothetical protein JCGZ_18840 [Jatropha curcas]|uniref:Uncharacterized protein n=1 Tax=Jatropha curcas TaxID=180498 RepID=A0A067K3Q6_JATCU|nr:hypothetical protein JCGZ_18840 [Jatropha curcas]